jgi:superfamily II RNA helicase
MTDIEKNKKCLQYLKTNDISVSKKFVVNELCLQLRDKEMFPALFFIFSRKQVQEYANELQVPLFCKDEKDYMAEPVCRQLIVSRVSNWKEYIQEAIRVSRFNGEIIISENIDRYEIINKYILDLGLYIKSYTNNNTDRWFYMHIINDKSNN